MYCRHKARPCRTICGLTCVGLARHQPIVADSRRDTAAAALLETIVLKRRFVRSNGDNDRDGEARRFGKLISPSVTPGIALSGVLSFRRMRSVGTNSSSSSPSGGVT